VSADARADVAVVVVTYNSASDIPQLIDDLRLEALDHPLRLIVVDNQSTDGTVGCIEDHEDVVLVEPGGNLGYAGGINVGLQAIGKCSAVLILNPDLTLERHSISRMFEALQDDRIGAVVPLMLDQDGTIYTSLRREPSFTRAIGDGLFGSKVRPRPGFSSEIVTRPASYLESDDVDWATGAALMVPSAVMREVGDWDEQFFLYSEETDYFRRIRETGRRVRYEHCAVVRHRRGGSGTTPALQTLMAVNRVRYVERHHGQLYVLLFRGAVVMAELLRSYAPDHRRTLAFVIDRRRWQDLPQATRQIPVQQLSGSRQRGAVIVPAYNEAAVIERTLTPLSQAAVDGFIELIVVCNGCTDDTADVARTVPGAAIVELREGSKPAALNAGDHAATLWPRLYLDADIQTTAAAVLSVLDRLAEGDVMAARPDFRYDSHGATALVRSYYRARQRIPQLSRAMWGAGSYGLSAEGHERFGAFPVVTGDDLFVDAQFDASEKAVVATAPSVVTTPADAKNLLAILRRNHRGNAEASAETRGSDSRPRNTSLSTVLTLAGAIRGPRSALDAAVYAGMALAARRCGGRVRGWERDESSRVRP
jgi:GT2 family glycosyltransferase